MRSVHCRKNKHVAPGGNFSNLVRTLSDGLAAFYSDLDRTSSPALTKRLTVVVQSEFGRRVQENAQRGTDHGTANPMLVLGGNVRGGKVYGKWPGLAVEIKDALKDETARARAHQLVKDPLHQLGLAVRAVRGHERPHQAGRGVAAAIQGLSAAKRLVGPAGFEPAT